MMFSIQMVEKMLTNKTEVILDEPIKYANSQANLVSPGMALNPKLLEFIKKTGRQSIKVSLSSKDLAKYELDCEVIPTVDNIIANKTALCLGNLIESHAFNEKNVGSIINNAKSLVEVIDVPTLDFKANLVERFNEETTKNRAVRVASFATVLGHEYNKTHTPNIDLNLLASATLFSFAGEICADNTILSKLKNTVSVNSKYPKLTEQKLQDVLATYDEDYNSIYSRNLIELSTEPMLDTAVFKQTVLLSSENQKGSGPLGYSLSLKDKSIVNVSAMIISLANMFDKSITYDIKNKRTLENTLSALQGMILSDFYDRELIKLIISSIPLYPIRTKVQIYRNNGTEYAYVVNNHKSQIEKMLKTAGPGEELKVLSEACRLYSRPVIATFPQNHIIDLSTNIDCIITNVVGSEVNFSELYEEIINNYPSKIAM